MGSVCVDFGFKRNLLRLLRNARSFQLQTQTPKETQKVLLPALHLLQLEAIPS